MSKRRFWEAATVVCGLLVLVGPVRANPLEDLTALEDRARTAMRDCDEAFTQLEEAMNPNPKISEVSSLTDFVRVECEGSEDSLREIGRLDGAPIEIKQKVDFWLSMFRLVASYRQDSSRLAARFVKSPGAENLTLYREGVGRVQTTQQVVAEALADAQKAAEGIGKMKIARGPKLAPSDQRRFNSFVVRVQAAARDCEALLRQLDAAMELPINRNRVVSVAPKVITRCGEAAKALNSLGAPGQLSAEIQKLLKTWVMEMTALADKRVEAGRTAQLYSEDGEPGYVSAFRQYQNAQQEVSTRASDYLIEAKQAAGLGS